MALTQREATIEAVESIIQYKFTNSSLLWEALHTNSQHPTIGGQPIPPDGNKRLAIVGDAVMQLVLAADWYRGSTNRGKTLYRRPALIAQPNNARRRSIQRNR